ncbi:hypothetical protein DIPPA_35192 [Diplonema papillatum]|nr:hypothetical protein DIPPA_35192 [Diplonema papillatum]
MIRSGARLAPLAAQARQVSQQAKADFSERGVVTLPLACVRREGAVDALKASFDELFSSRFATGNYPDEVHWRQGISKDDACREICNGWKADPVIARVVLSGELGKLACDLMGWEGARIAQDDLVWKTPGSGGVAFHTDAAYISNQFSPRDENSVTIWIPLDHATEETGVVQYALGSHRWPRESLSASTSTFHNPDVTAALTAAAKGNPVDVSVEALEPGFCFVHHQDVWHGSTANSTSDRHRRALVCHLLRADVAFREGDWRNAEPGSADYIYGRYKLWNSTEVLEDFFPVTYSRSGYRTPWLADYLRAA